MPSGKTGRLLDDRATGSGPGLITDELGLFSSAVASLDSGGGVALTDVLPIATACQVVAVWQEHVSSEQKWEQIETPFQEEEFQLVVSSQILPNLEVQVPLRNPGMQLQHLFYPREYAQSPSAEFCSKPEPSFSVLLIHVPRGVHETG